MAELITTLGRRNIRRLRIDPEPDRLGRSIHQWRRAPGFVIQYRTQDEEGLESRHWTESNVEWALHPSFPNPVRRKHDRANNFRLDTGGWGVFGIVARIKLKDAQELKLSHYLSLSR